MKHILIALLLTVFTPLSAQHVDTKAKTAHPAPPPAAQAKIHQPAHRAPGPVGTLSASLSSIDNKHVSLRWNNPEGIDGIFDDFESHSDFVVNSPGDNGWSYIDADNAPTYIWTAADFPNQGQPMAYIVFNPSKTSPSTETWPDIKPYSGKKMLIDFTVDGGNNDFLISPELHFDEDFQFSFQARSYTESYGKERFRVGYSTTGTRPSDFTYIQGGDYAEVPAAWTLCSYTIPKEAKYVCLNCVSQEAFMFMVDDIFIGTNLVRPASSAKAAANTPRLEGFNLLRDGSKVNETLITQTSVTDSVPDYGTYTYSVQAVMTDGSVSTTSAPIQVTVPDIRLLPFFDDFDTNTIEDSRWERPVDDQGNENEWRSDYYAYGLVDFSACYPYSKLGSNYSQSLITRELRTTDANNTYLRFEVRLDNSPKYKGNYLSAEVSADGGATWHPVVNIANDEGSFDWRRYEYSLKDILKGAELFKVRFRAHGENSWNISYWYLDDVKVWCPVTRNAALKVSSAGQAVSGAQVTLEADNGARYSGATDGQGNLPLPRLELGNYNVTVEAQGCNLYTNTWNVTADSPATLQVNLLRPIASWSANSISMSLPQESEADQTLTLTNTGDGELFWTLTPQPAAQSGNTARRFEIGKSFDASGDLQASVAFDGEFFYTASDYTLGRYYKYDRDGHFVEEFAIPGMYYKLFDLAYDGTYFYGSDNSNRIFQLDFHNKRLIREWDVKGQTPSSLTITHISYDPRNDQFWIGDWSRLGRVDREGNVTVDFYNIGESADKVSIFGSAFDNVSEGGPYLWLSNLNPSGLNQIDKVTLCQYDLNNRRLTDVSHSAIDVPGYKTGSDEVGYNNLGGIELTTLLVPGQLTLVGILQQSPSRIFTYRMADFDDWYTVQPLSGTLEGGAKAELKVSFDTRGLALNEARQTSLRVNTLPALAGQQPISLSLTANAAASHPRPVGLQASVNEETSTVALSWQAAKGTVPAAYEVLRDSVRIATVETASYSDESLVRGTYAYTVRALYGDERAPSAQTDTVKATIKVGAPYFAPTSLQASLSKNKEVSLSWQKPDALLHEPATLRWDNGQNDDAIGLSDGGYFYAGIGFDASDLEAYRGTRLTSVDVFVKERVTALSLKVYRDGKAVLSQRISTDGLKYGEYNTVTLDDPVTIERGSDYKVAFLFMHESGLRPLGVSSGATTEGKSNLMSENGRVWYPASYIGFANANFNIALHLSPAEGYTEASPTSYRILRNGQEVGTSSATEFSETLSSPGNYTYQVVSLYGQTGTSLPSDEASVTVEDIGTPLAPSSLTASVERNRKVTLHWGFPLASTPAVPIDLATAGTSPAGKPEFVSAFRGAVTGEMGFASDGHYIYTTRHAVTGIINRYHMDGTFDDSYSISSNLTNGFLNLTYDGTDFWATAKSNAIYKLDLDNMTLTDTRSISEIARHIAYVPTLDAGHGGFEVGDWETSIHVTMQGAKLGNGPSLKGAAGSAYYNGVLYTFEQGYETTYELCARQFETGELLWHAPISDWTAISPATGASAGGMSVLHTPEGLNLLCVALQEPAGTRFIFLDLGSVKGLAGYNVYRNGKKVNTAPLEHRNFEEALSEAGTYTYQIQTEYVDGSVSALSDPQTVTIVPATPGEVPTDIKARAATAGYNVNLSMVDPTSQAADQYSSYEDGHVTGATGFTVTTSDAFDGSHALEAPAETECELILPVNKSYGNDFALSFVARNGDDREGAGSVQVLASSHSSDNPADFVNLSTVSTTEAWKRFELVLPAATRYVALRCPARYASQFIDAVTVNTEQAGQVYAYDIMRDDSLLTSEPSAGVSYTDHNLLPGTYTYRVRAYYENSSVSEWSDPVSISIDYSNGHQAPGQLSVEQPAEGNLLKWSTPALSGVTELRWHNGVSYGAAGMPSGGSFYAGVQFDKSDLQDYASLSVSEISFYINQVPDVLYVQLYQGQELVFEKYVPTLRQYAMNTVRLDTPIAVNPSKSLRAVIYVEHNQITVPLGYDEGPAKTGRGDLYSPDGLSWSTLSDNDIDGNWNISIGLQAYASPSVPQSQEAPLRGQIADRYMRHASGTDAQKQAIEATDYGQARTASMYFSGYHVYCNGELLHDTPLSTAATSYLDTTDHKGRYLEYQVKAIYPDFGEVGSNIVRIVNTGIGNVTVDENTQNDPAYTIDGKRATEDYRGPVISQGRKRIQ